MARWEPGPLPGTTLLPVNYVAGPQSQQETTDGAYMLDISKGTISGVVTGPETLVEGTSVHVMPVTARLPLSTGIGIVDNCDSSGSRWRWSRRRLRSRMCGCFAARL